MIIISRIETVIAAAEHAPNNVPIKKIWIILKVRILCTFVGIAILLNYIHFSYIYLSREIYVCIQNVSIYSESVPSGFGLPWRAQNPVIQKD